MEGREKRSPVAEKNELEKQLKNVNASVNRA